MPAFLQGHIPISLWGSMSRLLLWPLGARRSIAVLIVMSMAATGGVTTIVTDSIAFHVNVGTGASSGEVKHRKEMAAGVAWLIASLEDKQVFVDLLQL